MPRLVVADEGFDIYELQSSSSNPNLVPQDSSDGSLRVLHVMQVIIRQEPAALLVNHALVLYQQGRAVMEHSDMRHDCVSLAVQT